MLRVRTGLTSVGGGPYLNTFYFDDESTDSAASAATAAVHAFWQAIAPQMITQCTWAVDSAVYAMTTDGTVTAILNGGSPHTGAGAIPGSPQPLIAQGLVRWHTGTYIGGREVRGRTFVPAIQQGDSTSTGTVNAPALTAMQNAINGAISSTANFAVWSKKHLSVHPITAGNAWNQWASLRSRRD